MGVLCYELLSGASPFIDEKDDLNDINVQEKILRRTLKGNILMPDFISEAAKDFVTRLLINKPSERLGKVNFKKI